MAKHVISHVMSQIPNEEMLKLLGNGQDRSDKASLANFPQAGPFPTDNKGRFTRTFVVCTYLNDLSAFFKTQEGMCLSYTLVAAETDVVGTSFPSYSTRGH